MGRPLREVYPYATKWEVIKWRVQEFFKWLLRMTTYAGISLGYTYVVFTAGAYLGNPSETYAVKEVFTDTLKVKIETLKTEVLNDLQVCESQGYNEDAGLVTFDPDKTGKQANIPSYGLFQFKKPTVIDYYKKFYNKVITGKEAITIALDEEKSRELARDVIFKETGGVYNWANCAKKKNLVPKIEVIKMLES